MESRGEKEKRNWLHMETGGEIGSRPECLEESCWRPMPPWRGDEGFDWLINIWTLLTCALLYGHWTFTNTALRLIVGCLDSRYYVLIVRVGGRWSPNWVAALKSFVQTALDLRDASCPPTVRFFYVILNLCHLLTTVVVVVSSWTSEGRPSLPPFVNWPKSYFNAVLCCNSFRLWYF